MTKSWPFAAAAGVGADLPPCCWTHSCALAAVRLYTVTSWPLSLRWRAMGKPMTPRPMNAIFADMLSPDALGPAFAGVTLVDRIGRLAPFQHSRHISRRRVAHHEAGRPRGAADVRRHHHVAK